MKSYEWSRKETIGHTGHVNETGVCCKWRKYMHNTKRQAREYSFVHVWNLIVTLALQSAHTPHAPSMYTIMETSLGFATPWLSHRNQGSVCQTLQLPPLRVVGHVVAKEKNTLFYWGGIKENTLSRQYKPENITILRKRLTFLLRTASPIALFFRHQLSN